MTNPIREGMERLKGRWTKGAYSDSEGNVCGLGSVRYSLGLSTPNLEVAATTMPDAKRFEEWHRAIKIMNAVAGEQYPNRTDGLDNFPSFNDHPDTTEEDVLRIMDKAAVEFESRVDFSSGV